MQYKITNQWGVVQAASAEHVTIHLSRDLELTLKNIYSLQLNRKPRSPIIWMRSEYAFRIRVTGGTFEIFSFLLICLGASCWIDHRYITTADNPFTRQTTFVLCCPRKVR